MNDVNSEVMEGRVVGERVHENSREGKIMSDGSKGIMMIGGERQRRVIKAKIEERLSGRV